MKYISLVTLLVTASFLSSCNKEEVATETTVSPLDAFLVSEAPADAQQISKVFEDPVPGKEVVLSGEIMGQTEPFADGYAIVTLGDPTKITPCNRIPGDGCPTPWDNCCDDRAVVKKSITTIQFLDKEGKVIKTGLKGYQGIKELSFLTVKGKIADQSNAENLLINASVFM